MIRTGVCDIDPEEFREYLRYAEAASAPRVEDAVRDAPVTFGALPEPVAA